MAELEQWCRWFLFTDHSIPLAESGGDLEVQGAGNQDGSTRHEAPKRKRKVDDPGTTGGSNGSSAKRKRATRNSNKKMVKGKENKTPQPKRVQPKQRATANVSYVE